MKVRKPWPRAPLRNDVKLIAMKPEFRKRPATQTVKIGASREFVIPRRFHDKLGLSPGDLLEVQVRRNQLILTPKALVDRRLDEGLEDIKSGRLYGPFRSVKQMLRILHNSARRGTMKASISE